MSSNATTPRYTVQLTGRRWLTGDTFELRFGRPAGFSFRPGQKIGFAERGEGREYTLLNGPEEAELVVCVRLVPGGRFTPALAGAPIGEDFRITAASGRFTFEASPRPPVLIATGTGIAPFVAFVRAGLRGFDLLHGVRSEAELYYRAELSAAARRYIPCVSEGVESPKASGIFAGRVDACLADRFEGHPHDFYLCGRTDMIRDVMRLIDQRFEGSFVFSEAFF